MLYRMVVMGDEELDTPHSSLEHRARQTSYVRPVEQKLFNLNYKRTEKQMSRSIDVSSIEKPSRKLFKKYYLPNSEAAQTIFLENYNRHDKYIYKEGKRVECKRIHNFYTSHMFRKGYDKCFRKTTDTFRLTQWSIIFYNSSNLSITLNCPRSEFPSSAPSPVPGPPKTTVKSSEAGSWKAFEANLPFALATSLPLPFHPYGFSFSLFLF